MRIALAFPMIFLMLTQGCGKAVNTASLGATGSDTPTQPANPPGTPDVPSRSGDSNPAPLPSPSSNIPCEPSARRHWIFHQGCKTITQWVIRGSCDVDPASIEVKVNGKHVEWSFVPATETIHIDRTDSGGQDDEIEITGCELRPN